MIHDSRHSNCDAYACRCPEGPRESTTDIGRCGRCGGDAAFIQPWDGPRYVSASEAASLNTYASRRESQSDSSPDVVEALHVASDEEIDAANRSLHRIAALPAQREPASADASHKAALWEMAEAIRLWYVMAGRNPVTGSYDQPQPAWLLNRLASRGYHLTPADARHATPELDELLTAVRDVIDVRSQQFEDDELGWKPDEVGNRSSHTRWLHRFYVALDEMEAAHAAYAQAGDAVEAEREEQA